MALVEVSPRRVGKEANIGPLWSVAADAVEEGGEDRVAETASLVLGKHGHVEHVEVPAAVTEDSLRCLAWGGRLLILGFLGGGPANIRSNYLLIKGIEAIGVRIGGLQEANPALAEANARDLARLAGEGKLRPRISHRFPLERAADALRAVMAREVIGKAVLVG